MTPTLDRIRAMVAAVLLAATALHAQERTKDAVGVGVVAWPAHAQAGVDGPGEIEACLTAHMRDFAPELDIASNRKVRDVLYPWLERATEPASEAEFAELLSRENVRQRLAQHGVSYLVAFSGGTSQARPGGLMLCGASTQGGGCFGFRWQGETTSLDAAVWSLTRRAEIQQRETETSEGRTYMPALLVPFPIAARTLQAACQELGRRIGAAIRRIEAAQPSGS